MDETSRQSCISPGRRPEITRPKEGKKDEATFALATMRAQGDSSKSASHEGHRDRPLLAACQTDPLVWRLEFQTGWIRGVQCYSRGMPRSTESHGLPTPLIWRITVSLAEMWRACRKPERELERGAMRRKALCGR